MLEQKGDAFGAEPLDLQKLQRGHGEPLQQRVAHLATGALRDLLQHERQALADAGNVGDLPFGVRQNIGYALGIAFDGRRAVAVAADPEAILTGDLHEVGGLIQYTCEVSVLQEPILREATPVMF